MWVEKFSEFFVLNTSRKVLEKFSKSSRKVLEKFSKSSQKVLKKFSKSSRKVHREFSESSQKVLRKFSESSRKVLGKFSESSRKVLGKFSKSLPNRVKKLYVAQSSWTSLEKTFRGVSIMKKCQMCVKGCITKLPRYVHSFLKK
jgi:uncharacterized membrane-anchored protein YhcB (DUF1043 family)